MFSVPDPGENFWVFSWVFCPIQNTREIGFLKSFRGFLRCFSAVLQPVVRGDRKCPGKLGFSFAIFVSRPLPYKIHGGKSCYPRAERQKYGLMRAPRRHAPPRELSGVACQLGGQGAHAGSREPRNKFSRFPPCIFVWKAPKNGKTEP